MQIKTFKKLKDNKYNLELDNNESIVLYDDIIVKFNLLVNKELDNKKLEEVLNENKKMEAYYISLKALNKKMRTKKEITVLLKKYEITDKVIDEIIDKLYKDNYLNDERYIKAYINDQINLSDKGPTKIKNNLIELGFDEGFINDYILYIAKDIWLNRIDKYINKKVKSTNNLSARKLKDKIVYDLILKGYYKEDIMYILNHYEFRDDIDLLKKEYNKLRKKLEIKYNGYELKMHLKNRLLAKGFSSEEINKIVEL